MKTSIDFPAVIFCFVLSATAAHSDGESCGLPIQKESNASPQGAMFENIDTNGDGSISKAEFDAYSAKINAMHLSETNASKDGRITPGEMQGTPKGDMRQNHAAAFL